VRCENQFEQIDSYLNPLVSNASDTEAESEIQSTKWEIMINCVISCAKVN